MGKQIVLMEATKSRVGNVIPQGRQLNHRAAVTGTLTAKMAVMSSLESAAEQATAIGLAKKMNGFAMTRAGAFCKSKNVMAVQIARTTVMNLWKSVKIATCGAKVYTAALLPVKTSVCLAMSPVMVDMTAATGQTSRRCSAAIAPSLGCGSARMGHSASKRSSTVMETMTVQMSVMKKIAAERNLHLLEIQANQK